MVGGEGERPVLLVHGALSHAGEWAMAGSCEGRTVIPDRPGCGLSDPVDVRRVGLRRSGERWLTAMVDALGVDEVDVVGCSTGGYFGLAFAWSSRRVRRLVTVGVRPVLRRTVPAMFRLFATPGIGASPAASTTRGRGGEPNAGLLESGRTSERIPVDILEYGPRGDGAPECGRGCGRFLPALWSTRSPGCADLLIDRELASLTVPSLATGGPTTTS